jgi:hypothetical protein
VPVRKGLYAEYLFEGNVKDTSGKKRHGVLRGASADYITGQDGSKGSALKFDGRVSVDLGYRFDLEEFTLSLWLKPDSAQVVFAILIDNSHGTGWGWVTQQLNSDANLYYLGLSSTDGKHVSAHFRLTPSRWQHVALVVSRDRCCTYLDGQVAEALPRTARLNLRGQGNLWLGNFSGDVENSSGRNWRGAIDDVAIYSRPLSAQEVRSLGKHVIRDESNPFSQ